MEADKTFVISGTEFKEYQGGIISRPVAEKSSEKPDKLHLPTSQDFEKGNKEVRFYSILKHVGQGTFGVVSKAIDNRIKRYVAIKKIPMEMACPSRELSLVSEMKHPNCIYVLNSFYTEEPVKEGLTKQYMNIVLEYIPDNLHKIIQHYYKHRADFPATLGMVYSYQLFRCLHYLQAVKVMHRDLKPQNVLVDTKKQQVFVCDFGSAKKYGGGEPNASYICSRYYRAPELLLGNQLYEAHVDLWSVGCVIAEMFLGFPIFAGENTKDQIKKIAEVIGFPDDYDLRGMGVKRGEHFDGVVPIGIKKKLTGKAPPQAIDLISKVLVYNPEKRIRPIDALLHPYFDPLRESKITINKQDITDLFNFQPEEIAGNERLINKLTPSWYFKKDDRAKTK